MKSSSQIITTNKPTSSFLQAGCPSCRTINGVTALKGKLIPDNTVETSTKDFPYHTAYQPEYKSVYVSSEL